MRYKQALAIGKSEGTIQCTYAIIYDKQGNKVFALQRKGFEKNWISNAQKREDNFNKSTPDIIVTYTGNGAEGIIGWDTGNGSLSGDTATGYITFDMPLVSASEWSGETLVPVRLLFPAIEYMKRTISSAQEIPIAMYYKFASPEEKEAASEMLDNGDMSFDGKAIDKTENKRIGQGWIKDDDSVILIAYRKGFSPIWENLMDALNEDTIYYVKPAAFNWQPVDLSNCTDADGVPYNERVRVAKEKLDRAKALLIASGTTIFA